jgi:ADP-ribosyl-[dinitrogen reductase] hydrolase
MKGCFYGCAIGDALGCPLEFKVRDSMPKVTEMIPTSNHGGLPAGSWTDDTSMMLCLAASMAARGGVVDAISELTHYAQWFRKGYLGVNGKCIDIGMTTKRSLLKFIGTGTPINEPADELDQGNGSLMRIAPVPIFCWQNPTKAFQFGYTSSLTTHNHPNCATVCGIVSYMLASIIKGNLTTKRQIADLLNDWKHSSRDERLISILDGEFMEKTRDQISSSGYIMDTLEAALWAFFSTPDFESGAILAVNLGRDADTVGAVYGTIAGAFYGFDTLPARWVDALQGRRYLDGVYTDVMEVIHKQ